MNRDERMLLPMLSRRTMLQAGTIGLMGLGISDLWRLRASAAGSTTPTKSVLFVFLTGGISHQDSFDLKPDAPDTVRGEFRPIATRTPGIEICEHLPLLAQRSDRFALVRSVGTRSNGHEEACHMLLTGRLDFPPGFNVNNVPSPNEWPSIAAQVTHATRGRNNLPPAVVLPQPSINEAGRVRPGQFAGRLGPRYEAWHLNMAAPCLLGNGACPNCFRFDPTPEPFHHAADSIFTTPMLALPDGGETRLNSRLGLLDLVENQQRELERTAEFGKLDRHRQQAISVLANPTVRSAFDVEKADAATLERYGKNKFGLSLLMGFRLIAAGVNLVQVNLGKNSSWDTHRRNFVNLKDNLLSYMDRAVSALLDDLASSGLLESTLVVLTGEFGRTPKIQGRGPRSLGAGNDSLVCRRRSARRQRDRLDRQDRRLSDLRPADAREPGRDDLRNTRHAARCNLDRHRRTAVRVVPRRSDQGIDVAWPRGPGIPQECVGEACRASEGGLPRTLRLRFKLQSGRPATATKSGRATPGFQATA